MWPNSFTVLVQFLFVLINRLLGTGQMKGALWRYLLVHYEEIILPAITDARRRESMRTIFSYLAEIQCIAYASPAAQKQKCVRLRMHILCFMLSIKMKETHPHITGNGILYVHTVVSHFPFFYERHDLRNGSTEAGEGFLAICKGTVLRFTSRRATEALDEVCLLTFDIRSEQTHII